MAHNPEEDDDAPVNDQAVVDSVVKAAIEIYRNGGEITLEGVASSLRERVRAGVEDALVGRPLAGNHGSFVSTVRPQLMPKSGFGCGSQNPSGSGNI
jgi:hypothetical protein